MTLLRDYVRNLTDDQRLQIVTEFEQFERAGQIGDGPLREHAQQVMEKYGADEITVTRWMRDLTFEIYRWYASIIILGLRAADTRNTANSTDEPKE